MSPMRTFNVNVAGERVDCAAMSDVFTCTKCGADLGGIDDRVASTDEKVMGDEIYTSYWECAECGWFTIETFRDSMTTGEHVSISGPIEPERGRELIRDL